MVDKKKCSVCGGNFPLAFFYRRNTRPCGYMAACKKCTGKQRKVDMPKHHERDQLTEQERNNRNRAFGIRSRPHIGSKQRSLVGAALRSGKLIKPENCTINNERCVGRLEAHHPEYNKPLDILWLCAEHHRAWHRVFLAE